MKKLVLFFAAVFITAVSANVFAQGTGEAPTVGSIHNYGVTFTSGNSYDWDVTSDFAGSTTVNGSVVSIAAGTDAANVNVTWVNPVPGTIYFVHVTETGADNCTNRKVLAVTPVNQFALQVVNYNLSDGDTSAVNPQICPADITVDGYNSVTNTFTYNYHKDSVYFMIEASGINLDNTDWYAHVTIDTTTLNTTPASITAGWSNTLTGTYTTGLVVDGSVSASNKIHVESATNNSGIIYLKVVANNSTLNEGLNLNDITVTLLDGTDQSEDENGNDVTNIGHVYRVQTIKARPATTGIVTD